ncbi:MAG: hypothetical protein Q9219_007285 [cf. Caloplaca sp. 3 TL-2023]
MHRSSVTPSSPATSPKIDSSPNTDPSQFQHDTRTSSSTTPALQRTRKRVPWRGKTCIVSLPPPLNEAEPKRLQSLTSHDAEDQPNRWQPQRQGIGQFGAHAQSAEEFNQTDLQAQTRPLFPDPVDICSEREKRWYRTKIPNGAQWNSYVEDLREARLRVLGVTLADNNHGYQSSPFVLPLDCNSSPQGSRPLVSPSLAPPHAVGSLPTHPYCGLPETNDTSASTSNTSPIATLEYQPSSTTVNRSPRHSVINPHEGTIDIHQNRDSPPQPPALQTERVGYPEKSLLEFKFSPGAYEGIQQKLRASSGCQLHLSREPTDGAQAHLMEDSIRPTQQRLIDGQVEGSEVSQRDTATTGIADSISSDPADIVGSANYLQHVQKDAKLQRHSELPTSGLNALAPEFKADIAGTTSPAMTGTTMRPTAPPFNPITTSQAGPVAQQSSVSLASPSFNGSNVRNISFAAPTELSTKQSSRLLSAATYPFLSASVKRSKAVPILSPKDGQRTNRLKHEVQKNEWSHDIQEGRQKRTGRSRQTTDQNKWSNQVISFTSEQHTNINTHKETMNTRDEHICQDTSSLAKAAWAANELKEIIDDLSASEGSSSRGKPTDGADSDGKINKINKGTRALASDNALRGMVLANTKSRRKNGDYSSRTSPANRGSVASKNIRKRVSSSPIRSSARDKHNIECLADADILQCKHWTQSSERLLACISPTSNTAAEQLQHQSSHSITLPEDHSIAQGCAKEILDGVSYIEPSYEENDAFSKRLDEGKCWVGTEDNGNSFKTQHLDRPNAHNHSGDCLVTDNEALPHVQDHMPDSRHTSLSAQSLRGAGSDSADSSVVERSAENTRFSPSSRSSHTSGDNLRPDHSVLSGGGAAMDEWVSSSSSSDEARISNEQIPTDIPLKKAVDSILQMRIAPLEQSLVEIQRSLIELINQLPNQTHRQTIKSDADTSDADDEDDLMKQPPRTKSPIKERYFDLLRKLAAQLAMTQVRDVPVSDLTNISEDLKELKTMLQEARSSDANVKVAVEEAIGKQLRGRSVPVTSSHQSATVERSQLQISGLESMLKIAEGRAQDELKARRAIEDALADSQRLLRLALQDAAEQRESAEETERSLSAFYEDRHEMLRRNAMLEGTQRSLENAASELAEKNTALEGTLEEYRLSSTQWRDEIESSKTENDDLRKIVLALKAELEEGSRARQAFRIKFDQLQDAWSVASQNIAKDQSLWHRKEEDHNVRYQALFSNFEREIGRSKRMETEIAALSKSLRLDREKHQQITADCDGKINVWRAEARLEQDQMRKIMDSAAEHQLKDLSTALRAIIKKLESQLNEASEASRTEKARHERIQEGATATKMAALHDQQVFHDLAMKSLEEQHEQKVHIILQERQSSAIQYKNRLALDEEKILHYQDKVQHLEEKLEIAESAARAAVQAVQSKQPVATGHKLHEQSTSDTIPEKISPQALRESILVLQEQLQDRESRVEQLEQKLCTVDLDAPTKLKAQETEITWLRELFDVRIDDLQDLILTLAQPAYDRNAIKDAAIRLKANLEMERLGKGRAQGAEQLVQSFPSIANFTSSPRTLAAAWGNWRRGWNAPASKGAGSADVLTADTSSPSLRSTQGILSGLLTPPRSSVRGGAQPRASPKGATSRSLKERPVYVGQASTNACSGGGRPHDRSPPMTPSLTLTAGYDEDATLGRIEKMNDTLYTEDGNEAEEEESFGLPVATFPRRT